MLICKKTLHVTFRQADFYKINIECSALAPENNGTKSVLHQETQSMNEINWNAVYKIGDTLIDTEHQELLAISQEALTVVYPKKRSAKIRKTLKKLYQYTKEHFLHEEQFMARKAYPKLEQHISQHRAIIETLNKLIKQLPTMRLTEFERELSHFIETGLVRHFAYQDMNIRLWMEKRERYIETTKWRDNYLTGHGVIDAQHKEIFDIAKLFFEEHTPTQRRVHIQRTFKKFLTLLNEHLKQEELYMNNAQYPMVQECIDKHKQFISKLDAFSGKIPTLALHELEIYISETIMQWFIVHTQIENKKMLAWVIQKKENLLTI
jgi:hemerythrin-like metal-binding protein